MSSSIEKGVLNSFFAFTLILVGMIFITKNRESVSLKKPETPLTIETLLININQNIIDMYTKNYNYNITHALLSRSTQSFVKNIAYVNRIMFVMMSDELKEQLQSDLVIGKLPDGEVTYTNTPNDEEWRHDTYEGWYYDAIGIKTPKWSPVYYSSKSEDDLMIINYTIPVHNRSEEGGNAFLMNLELKGEIIKHVF